MEELRRRCFERMENALQEHTVLQGELEEEIWNYYRKTSPSLQEFYSRYTPEWEVFYEHESLQPSGFLDFLYRMQAAFRKRYSLLELDVAYYIEELERYPLTSPERKQVQDLFLDKWYRLLTAKEFDFQYHQIAGLCDKFLVLDKAYGLETASGMNGSRVKWLLLNHPQLYRQVLPYEKIMESNRHIKELIRVLGKHDRGEILHFDALSGVRKERLVHQSSYSDIEGIMLGDDLNHLLPLEYCYLTDDAFHPIFMQRYMEKKLQVFDCRSRDDLSAVFPSKKQVNGRGPFIVCLDTSGSMQGKREALAKSALLAVSKLTEQTHRSCYIINFAEEIHTLLVKNLKSDLPLLVEFLNHRFDGGTNIGPAIDEAVRMIRNNGWRKSDIVMISDFEMPPAPDELIRQFRSLKCRETSFYALVFGSCPEMDYLNVCDRYWNMEIP